MLYSSFACWWLLFFAGAMPSETILDARLHHLRSGGAREWTDFPAAAEGPEFRLVFQAQANTAEQTLRVRHIDVKQRWDVRLNGKPLTQLSRDENDIVTLLPLRPGALRDGENELLVIAGGKDPDDVRIGDFRLLDGTVDEVTRRATLSVIVTDESGGALPCRLTIVDRNGSRMPLGAKSGNGLAVRNGGIYTADGRATLGVIPGAYTIYASRGFEYSVDSVEIKVEPGETLRPRLQIQRELTTPGYVSCDTHVHTLTHSGHGDCSMEERMLSIPGEGLELPIATDHNFHADYEPLAQAMGLRKFFTPVRGNEVTTNVGHFNIFPVAKGAAPPDFRGTDWQTVFAAINATPGVQVIILNHARDVHSGFRPFDPKNHIAPAGENLEGWPLQANAMELVNSGALQTDPMRLYHDWFGLLNRGLRVTPIGASDSHDCLRKLVGQARTYIRCPDDDPANIDVDAACKSLLEGRVVVSMGLFTEIKVDDRYEVGDLAPVAADAVRVAVRVLGPSWVTADRVRLFANGQQIREASIASRSEPSVLKWNGVWRLPKPRHDVHLVAIASGPGVTAPHWPIPRTYQPVSPHWNPYTIGSTGPVWLDADGDGKWTSASEYAARAAADSKGTVGDLIKELAVYDAAIATQAASLLAKEGRTLQDAVLRQAVQEGTEATREGFRQYFEAWKESQAARAAAR